MSQDNNLCSIYHGCKILYFMGNKIAQYREWNLLNSVVHILNYHFKLVILKQGIYVAITEHASIVTFISHMFCSP